MECKECGKLFPGRVKTQKYCSLDCQRKAVSRRYYANKQMLPKRCPLCGKDFFTYRKDQKYCSKGCQHNASLEHIRLWQKNHIIPFIRLRFQVFERDQFKCQYCGRGVEDGVKLELDHIFPKSQGGKDELQNCVTACQDCNLGKAGKILAET